MTPVKVGDEKRGWRVLHTSVTIAYLLGWDDERLSGMVKHPNGVPMYGSEVRIELRKMQARGAVVVPLGQACEGFSYETGCPGHAEWNEN